MTWRHWVLAGGIIVALALSCPTTLAARGGVPTWARDADCDGHVSVGEWYELGIDHGWRPAVLGPSDCTEVFDFKDGSPVVLRCESEPRCRVPRRPRR